MGDSQTAVTMSHWNECVSMWWRSVLLCVCVFWGRLKCLSHRRWRLTASPDRTPVISTDGCAGCHPVLGPQLDHTCTDTNTHTSLISTSKRPPLLLNLETRSVIVLPPAVKKDAMTVKKFKTTSSCSGPKPRTVKDGYSEKWSGESALNAASPRKAKHWLGRMSETPKLSEAPSPSKPNTRSLVLTTGPQRPNEILLVTLSPIFNFTQHLHFGNMKGIMTSDRYDDDDITIFTWILLWMDGF